MTKRKPSGPRDTLYVRFPPGSDLKAKVSARADKLGISDNELANRSLAWLVEQPIRSTQTTERF